MRKWFPLIIIGSITLLIDQIAKWWVINNMLLGETRLIAPFLQPYLQITRATNSGIAFGIGEGGSPAFLVLSVIIVGLLLYVYTNTETQFRVQLIALSFVIGGALGNIIDRIRFNHVVDFVHITIPDFISNVSNFADHFIIIGVVILLIDTFRQPQSEPENTPADAESNNEMPSISTEIS
ncbi:MAG: signal peptidase II [Chloroflexota bacterium]